MHLYFIFVMTIYKMKLIACETGAELEAVIERANENDLKKVKRGKQFGFDWNAYIDCDIYKLTLLAKKEILGLIAIRERPERGYKYVELKAIELSKPNVGSRKKIKNIAGCLIAYVAKIAFDNGCDGYVRVEPKTALYEHYITKYGFVPVISNFLFSNTKNSERLVAEFL